jgi:hypothetical protein
LPLRFGNQLVAAGQRQAAHFSHSVGTEHHRDQNADVN